MLGNQFIFLAKLARYTLLKEMNEEFRKEKLVKEAVDQESKISDQMTLDALKSKYESVLKNNGAEE